jgi:quinol monooxygenase YgiN
VFTVEPANQQRLIDLLTDGTERSVRYAPGFISVRLHRSLDGTKVRMYAQWRSIADYEAMRADPAPLLYLQQALAIAKLESGMYEVVNTFAPATRATRALSTDSELREIDTALRCSNESHGARLAKRARARSRLVSTMSTPSTGDRGGCPMKATSGAPESISPALHDYTRTAGKQSRTEIRLEIGEGSATLATPIARTHARRQRSSPAAQPACRA